MSFPLKRIFFSLFFNSSLFLTLMIGIQNSSKNSKVYFFKRETVNLPISFIVGASFISGSLVACFLSLNNSENKKSS